MSRRFLNLVVIVSILSLVVLSSCSKGDDPTPELPDYSQDKGEFTDVRDGNEYKWVKIGNQIWMAENLNYTGSEIQHITDNDEWINNTSYDGWSYYDNNVNNGNTYGALYQWEAAKKACPSGWHLPTDDEWTKMENYLKANGYSYDGVIGNSDIAKSLAANYGWAQSIITGAVGNSDYPDFRNKIGFSALPGGYRFFSNGMFSNVANHNVWWSSKAELISSEPITRSLNYDYTNLKKNHNNILNGFSVRCVKD